MILVTGSDGFIGRNMISTLESNGYLADGYEWDGDSLPDISKYDWVIHLGAIADNSYSDVDTIMTKNTEFSKTLFNECNRLSVNLQYASSSTVYGNTNLFTESNGRHPQTPYAWSKYLFDRWVFQQPRNIIVQGFRYFNVYGNLQHLRGNRANYIHKCNHMAKTLGHIELWQGAENITRDWTNVIDLCNLQLDFIRNVSSSSIWNVGPGSECSFYSIAHAVAKRKKVPVIEVPIPEDELSRWRQSTCADISYLEQTVGKRDWHDVYQWINTNIEE